MTHNNPSLNFDSSFNMLGGTCTDVALRSTNKIQPGWSKLSTELKLEIYEHLTNHGKSFEKVAVPGKPEGSLREVFPHLVEYSSKGIPWAARGLGKHECMVYEQVIKRTLRDTPLTLHVNITNWEDIEFYPLKINEAMQCIPPSCSSAGQQTIRHMQTWGGILIAAAYEAFEARIKSSHSSFSFDVDRLDAIVSRALTHVGRALLEMREYDFKEEDGENGREFWFRTYVQQAFIFLCLKQAVCLILPLFEFDMTDRADYVSLIHDLRYFADNSLLEIRVRVSCKALDEEKWKTWLTENGGQIKWEFVKRI